MLANEEEEKKRKLKSDSFFELFVVLVYISVFFTIKNYMQHMTCDM